MIEEEIRELVEALDPPAFFQRINEWRRAGIAGAQLGDVVSGTRPTKIPAFDKMDKRLNEAEAKYRELLKDASVAKRMGLEHGQRRALRDALNLQRKWLTPKFVPDAEMAKALSGLVSDAQSCNTCGDTKEGWVKRQKKRGVKTPLWRLRGGDCFACYQTKRRAKLATSDPEAVAS